MRLNTTCSCNACRNIDQLVLGSAVLHEEGEAVTRQAVEQGLAKRTTRRTRKDGRLVDLDPRDEMLQFQQAAE